MKVYTWKSGTGRCENYENVGFWPECTPISMAIAAE